MSPFSMPLVSCVALHFFLQRRLIRVNYEKPIARPANAYNVKQPAAPRAACASLFIINVM